MPDPAVGRLMREYKQLSRQQDAEELQNICVRPDPDSMLIWHYVLHDLPSDTPYSGGVYHGKLVFPAQYPFQPPSILMLTPNGRFDVDKRLCLSMSDYHPESWNPAWRIESILTGLISFMIDEADPSTTGAIRATFSRRKALAVESFMHNKNNPAFEKLFPEFSDNTRYDNAIGFSLKRPAKTDSITPSSTQFPCNKVFLCGSSYLYLMVSCCVLVVAAVVHLVIRKRS